MIRSPIIRDHIPAITLTIVIVSIVAAIFALGVHLAGGWRALVALAVAIVLGAAMAAAVNRGVPHAPPRTHQH